MKALIKHLWKTHQEEIVAKSFLHCHVRNVHSIMFMDTPEKTIRLYIADLRNELFYNYPDNYKMKQMTTAFHPHHCDLTLHCVKGSLTSWAVKESTVPRAGCVKIYLQPCYRYVPIELLPCICLSLHSFLRRPIWY